MSKITLGPWEVNGQRPYIIACTDGTYMNKSCMVTAGKVSNSSSYHMAEDEINEANARLTVAARNAVGDNVDSEDLEKMKFGQLWDGYKELLGALRFYMGICGNTGYSTMREQFQLAYKRAEQAIAKADL